MWRNIVQGTIVSNCQGHMQQRTQNNELMRFHGNSVMLYIPRVYFDVVYTVRICVCVAETVCVYCAV
jgi:hypothetical protein